MRGSIILEIYRMTRTLLSGRKKYYSQCGEDFLASLYLPEKKINYIDIGSGNPIDGSNTYLFYKRGGSGICVDLVQNNIMLSKWIRPRDKVLRSLVIGKSLMSEQRKTFKWWEMYPPGYSTASVEDFKSALRLGASLVQQSEIDAMSFQEVWEQLNPKLPLFLTIDTEGLDFDILSAIDFGFCRPRVICVETPSKITRENTDSLLVNAGYVTTGRTILSSIYTDYDYLRRNDQLKHWI